MAADISVTTTETSDGWDADVVVEDADGGTTEHRVGVKRGDWERLTGGRGDVAELVRRSFAFLLEREPKESILRRFDLMVIGRYFPGYEGEIRAGDW